MMVSALASRRIQRLLRGLYRDSFTWWKSPQPGSLIAPPSPPWVEFSPSCAGLSGSSRICLPRLCPPMPHLAPAHDLRRSKPSQLRTIARLPSQLRFGKPQSRCELPPRPEAIPAPEQPLSIKTPCAPYCLPSQISHAPSLPPHLRSAGSATPRLECQSYARADKRLAQLQCALIVFADS